MPVTGSRSAVTQPASSNSHPFMQMSPFRVTRDDLFADILVDRRAPDDVWVYVVQRLGSPEILAMGTCSSQEKATQLATELLNQFRARSAKAG